MGAPSELQIEIPPEAPLISQLDKGSPPFIRGTTFTLKTPLTPRTQDLSLVCWTKIHEKSKSFMVRKSFEKFSHPVFSPFVMSFVYRYNNEGMMFGVPARLIQVPEPFKSLLKCASEKL